MNKNILNNIFKNEQIDVIFSMSHQTRLWYSKINTSDGWMFIEPKKSYLFVDSRYIEYAQKNAKNVEVKLIKNYGQNFIDFAKEKKYKTIGIEGDYLTIDENNFIKQLFPNAKFKILNGKKLRLIKSKEEIELIKKACKISLQALNEIKKSIKPGMLEIEIDHQLNLKLKTLGACKESFDSIVVSGTRGALPHGKPTNKKIENGELLTIDFGVKYKGYVSDITRTFMVGIIKNKKLIQIQKIVKEAQQLGIKAIKPGVSTFNIDKICRDYITNKGFGKYFLHSTGHGIGIDVHELPYISSHKKNDTILKEGMVITIEPGIYIEGIGGCRIEDNILVTKNSYQILSE